MPPQHPAPHATVVCPQPHAPPCNHTQNIHKGRLVHKTHDQPGNLKQPHDAAQLAAGKPIGAGLNECRKVSQGVIMAEKSSYGSWYSLWCLLQASTLVGVPEPAPLLWEPNPVHALHVRSLAGQVHNLAMQAAHTANSATSAVISAAAAETTKPAGTKFNTTATQTNTTITTKNACRFFRCNALCSQSEWNAQWNNSCLQRTWG